MQTGTDEFPDDGIAWFGTRWCGLIHAAVLMLAIVGGIAGSAFTAEPATDARAAQLKDVFLNVASDYRITTGVGTESAELQLRKKPVMHWLSLEGTTGSYMGSVFIWTHRQRPDLIGTLFTSNAAKDEVSICQELYSFAHDPLEVRSGNKRVWHPAPQMAMQAIPGAPVPAASEQGRRLQIRTMARHFAGRMNRRGVPHTLRLLPRPIYQYECEAPEISTGALLVLVAYTTDPDILLLIESRQTANGPQWFFQPARFSDKSLWLSYRGQDVWTSWRQGHGTDQPHVPDRQYHVDFITVTAPLAAAATTDTP